MHEEPRETTGLRDLWEALQMSDFIKAHPRHQNDHRMIVFHNDPFLFCYQGQLVEALSMAGDDVLTAFIDYYGDFSVGEGVGPSASGGFLNFERLVSGR